MTVYEPSPGKPARRSPTVAIVIGVALVVLVLVAVVISVRSKGDGDQADTTTSSLDEGSTTVDRSNPGTGATSVTSGEGTPLSGPDRQAALDKLGAAIPLLDTVPDGDYSMVCAELLQETRGVTPPNDIAGFIALLDRLNLPKLAVLAPTSVRDSFMTLVDTFPAASAVVVRAPGGVPDPDDLPDGFLAAAAAVINVSSSQCAGGE